MILALISPALACPFPAESQKFITNLIEVVDDRPTLLKRSPNAYGVEVVYTTRTSDGGMWLTSRVYSDLERFNTPFGELGKLDAEWRVSFTVDGTPTKSQITNAGKTWPENSECGSIMALATSLVDRLR